MQNAQITQIDEEQARNARFLSARLDNSTNRKRYLIDVLGLNCAVNYFYSKNIKADTKKSIYKVPLLYEEFRINDIYYNSYKIYVVTLYQEKVVKIPKIHAEMGVLPDFYFIVQIGSRVKEAKLIGFIEGKNIVNSKSDSKYYYPRLDLVFGFEKFKSLTKYPLKKKNITDSHVDCMSLFLKFIDKDLSSTYKKQFINHIMNCEACLARFIDTIEFEQTANAINQYPDIVNKKPIQPQQTVQTNPINNSINAVEPVVIEPEIEKNPQYNDYVEQATIALEKNALNNDYKGKRAQIKKFIESVFVDMPRIEIGQIKTLVNTNGTRTIITTAVLFFVLITFSLISLKDAKEIKEQNSEIAQFGSESANYSESDFRFNHQAQLIPKQRNIEEFSIKQPILDKPVYTPDVSKVSWEAPESIVKNKEYTKFLQLTGKNIKLNLQNDLLLVNDAPINRVVKADISIGSLGDIRTIKINKSSGSRLIDNSIEKVVTDTLKFMKPPAHRFLSKPITITLTVELN